MNLKCVGSKAEFGFSMHMENTKILNYVHGIVTQYQPNNRLLRSTNTGLLTKLVPNFNLKRPGRRAFSFMEWLAEEHDLYN